MRGKVLELNGDGDWVDCGNDLLFDMAQEMTISSWIKVTGPFDTWRAVIAKGTGWRLQRWRNTVQFACGVNVPGDDIGEQSGIKGRSVINDGRWRHIAGVYDGRTTTLYIDGRRDVSAVTSGPIPANSLNLWIGWNSYSTNRAWNGLIDDVCIYSYALTATEIKKLFKGKEPLKDKK